MKLKIWVKDEKSGVTAGPFTRTLSEWTDFFHGGASIQVQPFGLLYWADGTVTGELGQKRKEHTCSFTFNTEV